MVRGLIGLLVLASILLGAAALLLRVPQLRDSLPESALIYLKEKGILDAIGAADGVSVQARTEADLLSDTSAGLVAAGSIAAGTGNQPVYIDDVITGYSTRSAGDVPSEITTIRPILGCRLTPPGPATVIGHVTAGESRMPVGMQTYSDLHLAAAVQDYVDTYRKLGPEGRIDLAGPSYEAYDVVVTETKAPVYLVLENRGGNRIWNIHAADGARIERVILLGGDQAGVANLDAVVPVEVILAPGLADCGIVPAYAPTAGQMADADPAEGAQPMSRAQMEQALSLADAYDIWFRDSFGVRAGESRVGYDVGTISVIGPVPGGDAPKAVWTPVKGAKLRTTHDEVLDIDGQVAPGQDFAARVVAIATKFAFGDLGRLRQGGSF